MAFPDETLDSEPQNISHCLMSTLRARAQACGKPWTDQRLPFPGSTMANVGNIRDSCRHLLGRSDISDDLSGRFGEADIVLLLPQAYKHKSHMVGRDGCRGQTGSPTHRVPRMAC